MGRIKKWKANIQKNRKDVVKLNKLGRTVWEGTLSSMPKSFKKKGKKYKSVQVSDIFGHKNKVVVELKK